jgi:hypothetical protein
MSTFVACQIVAHSQAASRKQVKAAFAFAHHMYTKKYAFTARKSLHAQLHFLAKASRDFAK